MKILPLYLVVLGLSLLAGNTHGEYLIPSKLDPAKAEAREKAFIPWGTQKESSAAWKKLSSTHVPIYYERKKDEQGDGEVSRDIYTPNPGTGYWVLAGLSEKSLFKTHREKLKIDDVLVSASKYTDERGNTTYWALWAPKAKAHLLWARMAELGIEPPKIELGFSDRLKTLAEALSPYTSLMALGALIMSILAVLIVRRKSPPAAQTPLGSVS